MKTIKESRMNKKLTLIFKWYGHWCKQTNNNELPIIYDVPLSATAFLAGWMACETERKANKLKKIVSLKIKKIKTKKGGLKNDNNGRKQSRDQ